MTATDVDSDAELRYRLVGPQTAYSSVGTEVDIIDYDYSVSKSFD